VVLFSKSSSEESLWSMGLSRIQYWNKRYCHNTGHLGTQQKEVLRANPHLFIKRSGFFRC